MAIVRIIIEDGGDKGTMLKVTAEFDPLPIEGEKPTLAQAFALGIIEGVSQIADVQNRHAERGKGEEADDAELRG